MKHVRSTLVSLSAAALIVTACGGSDAAGSGPQKELADAALEFINEFAGDEGIKVDEDCVRKVIGDLSDTEAADGLAALNGESDSDAFDATGEKIEDDCFSEA